MTQLIVSLEDNSMVAELKRAIKMLKGVVAVKASDVPNPATLAAIREIENGDTIRCSSFDDFAAQMNDALRD